MANDIVPQQQHWWESLNIPAMLAGPAGNALSRLIGALIEIPAAGLDRIAQDIKNKTEAKALMVKSLSQAAAESAVAGRALVERAADSFLTIRRQANKEAVAQKAIEHLASNTDNVSSQPENIDDDWFNIFERYAEDASSDRLRDLWGRILAGQLRRPRSFSLSTLRFVAELEQDTATLFEQVAISVADGDFIPKPLEPTQDISHLLHLEDVGLITGASGILSRTKIAGTHGTFLRYRSHAIRLVAPPTTRLEVPGIPLTRIGREIYTVLSPPVDDIARARELVTSRSW